MVFVPCYGMFCGFNSDGFGGRFCGFTLDGVRACLRSCFGSNIWCTIATHMGFKPAASGCIAPTPL